MRDSSKLPRRAWLALELERSGLDPREVEDLADDSGEPVRTRLDAVEEVSAGVGVERQVILPQVRW